MGGLSSSSTMHEWAQSKELNPLYDRKEITYYGGGFSLVGGETIPICAFYGEGAPIREGSLKFLSVEK